MNNTIGNLFLVILAGIVTCTLSVAAPAAKPKEEKLPPPTEEQYATAQNNLKEIALAWHNFEAANGHLPSNVADKKGKLLLSWRVQILPYIEEEELYKQFKLDEPWDSENNKKLIDKMPKLYAPIRVKADAGLTYYQSTTGKQGLLKPGEKLGFANITDGTSNTFMVVEAAKPVVWSKPDDLVFDGKDFPALGGMFDGKFNAAFCDGSVRRFRKGLNSELLGKLVDPADGNAFDLEHALDDEK